MKKVLIVLVLILCMSIANVKAEPAHNRYCVINEESVSLTELLDDLLPGLEATIDGSNLHAVNLYNIQISTANILEYFIDNKDFEMLDKLLSLYLRAIPKMNYTNKYNFHHWPTLGDNIETIDKQRYMWLEGTDNVVVGHEIELSVAQYLALISRSINFIASVDIEDRTPIMNSFVQQYEPILKSHIERWVQGITVNGEEHIGPFQYRGWGCKTGSDYTDTGLSHSEAMNIKEGNIQTPTNSLCDAVLDTDLWIIYDVANYIAANEKDNSLININNEFETFLKSYLNQTTNLIDFRMLQHSVQDFNNDTVNATWIGGTKWDSRSENEYAGYTGSTFPTSSDKQNGNNVGWDLSHARRLVLFYKVMNEERTLLNLNFPTNEDVELLTNQIALKVFNGDFEKPLFSNYISGLNGWYRVGYNGDGFGYSPFQNSITFMTGGWSFLDSFNNNLKQVSNAVVEMLNSENVNIRQHVIDNYEHYFWSNYAKIHSVDFSTINGSSGALLQYCPSITRISKADVNHSDTIDSIDAMLVLRKVLGMDMTNTSWVESGTTGDVDNDGGVDMDDVNLILRYSLGLDMTGTGWVE